MKHLFNKAIRLLLITNGLVLLAAAMLGPIAALFVEKIGGDLFDASLTGGIFALAAGITTLYSGKLSDKVRHPQNIVALGYFIMGVGFLGYLLVENIYTLFVVQVIIGFGEAIYSPPFDAVYSKHLAKTKRGREWGAWESLNYFTAAAGAAMGGAIVTLFGFSALFVTMGVLSIVSGCVVYFTKDTFLD